LRERFFEKWPFPAPLSEKFLRVSSLIKLSESRVQSGLQRLPLEGKLSTKETDEVVMTERIFTANTSSGAARHLPLKGEGFRYVSCTCSHSMIILEQYESE
jgi:hypothetical protein